METPNTNKVEVHSIFDSESLKRQAEGLKIEQHKAEQLANYLAKMCEARHVIENQMDSFEKQQGRKLLAPIFESKVKTLVPNIVFFTKPLTEDQARFCNLTSGSSIKSMDVISGNSHTSLIGYQNHPILPEYTIILLREVKVYNPLTHDISAKEFPQAHLVEDPNGVWQDDEDKQLGRGWSWKYDGATPYETVTYEPAGTLVGWRTILARLVLHRLASPDAIEKEFGTSDRESWAVRMGKRDTILPAI